MKVGISGHRPEKIPDESWTRGALRRSYEITRASLIYQGMASGVDLWSAREAWSENIPYICVRPWSGHRPRIADIIEYDKTIRHSKEVVNVSSLTSYPGPWIYFKRNEWIVDSSDVLIAVWDGSGGGTKGCVDYAVSKDIPILQINPKDRSIEWINYTTVENGCVRDS